MSQDNEVTFTVKFRIGRMASNNNPRLAAQEAIARVRGDLGIIGERGEVTDIVVETSDGVQGSWDTEQHLNENRHGVR